MDKYAGGEGKYGAGRDMKGKPAYGKPAPVSRSELSGKASRQQQEYSDSQLRKMAGGTARKSGSYQGKSFKSPVQKLNRSTVADLDKLRVKNTAGKQGNFSGGPKSAPPRESQNSSARSKLLASNTQRAIAKVPSRSGKYESAGKAGEPGTVNRSSSMTKSGAPSTTRQRPSGAQRTAKSVKPAPAPKYSFKPAVKTGVSSVQKPYQPARVQKQAQQKSSFKAAPQRSKPAAGASSSHKRIDGPPQQGSSQKSASSVKSAYRKSAPKQKT